ncbi:hypothetical protein GNI_018440 [Gregarina niphandrodes]|uniref:Uncharacterized protein n=1 Tax=Gregarina niphandrodes TaxID=110365 RepID=A0A023BC46_GRENI|nr:hypothetical protein GNI_018440 [Gregarina niphandrodes]EZG81702.1 hypothetical protein GNI_018440 [Gregarina niphandrodes]|eukprot:XP_011134208.1 hypothetical protein GNI_018440 [Gregarina niphandrodes]
MAVTGYDFQTLMTDIDEKRDKDDTSVPAKFCRKAALKSNEEYEEDVRPFLDLFMEGISATVTNVVKMYNEGWRHCTLTWDSVIVMNPQEFVVIPDDLQAGEPDEAQREDGVPVGEDPLPDSMGRGRRLSEEEDGAKSAVRVGRLKPFAEHMDIKLRFTHHAVRSRDACRNVLEKNIREIKEEAQMHRISFERSSIPDKTLRYHHIDSRSVIQEADLFAELFLLHTVSFNLEPHKIPTIRKMKLFRAFNKYTLGTYSGREINMRELIDWYQISQGILRDPSAISFPEDILKNDPWRRNGYESTDLIEKVTGFTPRLDWDQSMIRHEFTVPSEFSASYYWRVLQSYRELLDPVLQVDYSDYSYVYGGHNLIVFGNITNHSGVEGDDEKDRHPSAFVDYCTNEKVPAGTRLVMKVPIANPRYAKTCYNSMVRADIAKHRKCFPGLEDLIVHHYKPPKSLRNYPLSFEEALEGFNARELFDVVTQELLKDKHKSLTGFRKLLIDVLQSAKTFWDRGYLHQDMTLVNLMLYPEQAARDCYIDELNCEAVNLRWIDYAYLVKLSSARQQKPIQDTTTISVDLMTVVDRLNSVHNFNIAKDEVKFIHKYEHTQHTSLRA